LREAVGEGSGKVRTRGKIAVAVARTGPEDAQLLRVDPARGDIRIPGRFAQRTGVSQQGGWLRIGLAAYHNQGDVVRALAAIEQAIRSH